MVKVKTFLQLDQEGEPGGAQDNVDERPAAKRVRRLSRGSSTIGNTAKTSLPDLPLDIFLEVLQSVAVKQTH